jgi:hypothetical protein
MSHDLESPAADRPDWDVLYRARGPEEVVDYRPIVTGDVFVDVEVTAPKAAPKKKIVIVLQHPCSMRPDGANLSSSLLVALVRPFKPLEPDRWNTTGKIMPLPDLLTRFESNKRHQAGVFESTFHVHPDDLAMSKRVACLSLRGVILLFQRWVWYSTRVVVPSFDFSPVIRPVYEEADLIEDWCDEAISMGRSRDDAFRDVTAWLNRDANGITRRQALSDIQRASQIRRMARQDAPTWQAPPVTVLPNDSSERALGEDNGDDDAEPRAG